MAMENIHEVFNLLQMNVVEHHKLPSFRLKKIRIVTFNLDSRICKRSILRDLIIHLEEIEIIPFDGYKLNDQVIDFCKEQIIDVVDKVSSITKFKLFKLQHWRIRDHGNKSWEFENGDSIGVENPWVLTRLFHQILTTNLILLHGTLFAICLTLFWENNFEILCFFYYRDWNSILLLLQLTISFNIINVKFFFLSLFMILCFQLPIFFFYCGYFDQASIYFIVFNFFYHTFSCF